MPRRLVGPRMPKPTTLSCIVYGVPSLEGYGESLTFKVTAYRKTKTGRRIDYVLRLESCRHGVKQLTEEVAKMQDRDREHIARQYARLENELAPLKRP